METALFFLIFFSLSGYLCLSLCPDMENENSLDAVLYLKVRYLIPCPFYTVPQPNISRNAKIAQGQSKMQHLKEFKHPNERGGKKVFCGRAEALKMTAMFGFFLLLTHRLQIVQFAALCLMIPVLDNRWLLSPTAQCKHLIWFCYYCCSISMQKYFGMLPDQHWVQVQLRDFCVIHPSAGEHNRRGKFLWCQN